MYVVWCLQILRQVIEPALLVLIFCPFYFTFFELLTRHWLKSHLSTNCPTPELRRLDLKSLIPYRTNVCSTNRIFPKGSCYFFFTIIHQQFFSFNLTLCTHLIIIVNQYEPTVPDARTWINEPLHILSLLLLGISRTFKSILNISHLYHTFYSVRKELDILVLLHLTWLHHSL